MKFLWIVSACCFASVNAFSSAPLLGHKKYYADTQGNRRTVKFALSMSYDALRTQLLGAKRALKDLLDKTNANPLMVRLAWHDSGTYDVRIDEWPKCGGAIGSIRFDPEITHGANKGLNTAVAMLEPIKKKFPLVSYADLFQMASATAIEQVMLIIESYNFFLDHPVSDRPVDQRYPCVMDVLTLLDLKTAPRKATFRLPRLQPENHKLGADPKGVYGTDTGTKSTVDKTPAGHLRKVFYRMGLGDREIVALSGAHTLGRAWKDRSGLGKESTKFTEPSHVARADGKPGIGKAGGQPWTEKWLKFDNSYFNTVPDPNADPELLKLSTDRVLFDDEGFKPYAEQYKASEAVFFNDYAQAHAKLSELGSRFVPKDGIKIDGFIKAKLPPSPYFTSPRKPWDS